MYNAQKKKRRHRRREYMARYREQKLEAMTPEDRTNILEKIRHIKQSNHFAEKKLFIESIRTRSS